MRLFFCAVLLVFVVSQQHLPQSPSTNQPTAAEQRGTQESPLVVQVAPTPKTKEEIDQDSKDRNEKASDGRWTIRLTEVLAFIAFCQLLVYAYQSYKLKQTVESAGEQAKAMERHIGEASRAATAMEDIAKKIQDGNKAIIRAYLTVTIGDALYQQRREGQGDLKFEARPNLINTGNTPARKVHIRVAADILPIPIPPDFAFPLPDREQLQDEGVVGSHQTYILAGTVKDFVPDAEVARIKEGDGRVLCVWGYVTYEDIFGEPRFVKFAQSLTWYPNGQIMGYYLRGQNDSN